MTAMALAYRFLQTKAEAGCRVNRNRVPPILSHLTFAVVARDAGGGHRESGLLLPHASPIRDRPPLPDVCAVKVLTGIPRPTCGLTRSLATRCTAEWAAEPQLPPCGRAARRRR